MKRMKKKRNLCILSALASAALTVWALPYAKVVQAQGQATITYEFTGGESDQAGYAQGTVTITSDTAAVYHLFWADDTGALEGYYEIDSKIKEQKDARLAGTAFAGKGFEVDAGGSASFTFGDHAAIPAGATKLIAVTDADHATVAEAAAVYDIPKEKRLADGSGNLLYTFSSYADVHIDLDGYYQNAQDNWAQALRYAADKDTDFILTAGDSVTNAGSLYEKEYKKYAAILAASDYTGNVWECNGNHDMRSGGTTTEGLYYGNLSFVHNTGMDSTAARSCRRPPDYESYDRQCRYCRSSSYPDRNPDGYVRSSR